MRFGRPRATLLSSSCLIPPGPSWQQLHGEVCCGIYEPLSSFPPHQLLQLWQSLAERNWRDLLTTMKKMMVKMMKRRKRGRRRRGRF